MVPKLSGGAEKGAKIQAKGSRCARHLARIFDQRPPKYEEFIPALPLSI
jgi:hypothetical protein